MRKRRSFSRLSTGKAALLALILTAWQAVPAHAQSLPIHVELDCTGRATNVAGRTGPYRQVFFLNLAARRFCDYRCGTVHALARWDETIIDLSRQSRPMPPGSDEVALSGFWTTETFDRRTGAFSGRELTTGSTRQIVTVEGRCEIRELHIRPVKRYLDTVPDSEVIPAPTIAAP
jgi:hypothetical protein